MLSRRLARLSLAGERVRLRPHRVDDDRAAFALLDGRQEILRWLVWDGPSSALDLREYYRHWRVDTDSGSDFRLAIEERAGPRLVGSITARFSGHARMGDVGYWLGCEHQGQGLGSEALLLLAHLAFRHLEAEALYAWVFVGNLASRRILERTGFSLVRSVPGRFVKQGNAVDEWHFVLLAPEWKRAFDDYRPQEEDLAWEEARGNAVDTASGPLPSGK